MPRRKDISTIRRRRSQRLRSMRGLMRRRSRPLVILTLAAH